MCSIKKPTELKMLHRGVTFQVPSRTIPTEPRVCPQLEDFQYSAEKYLIIFINN